MALGEAFDGQVPENISRCAAAVRKMQKFPAKGKCQTQSGMGDTYRQRADHGAVFRKAGRTAAVAVSTRRHVEGG